MKIFKNIFIFLGIVSCSVFFVAKFAEAGAALGVPNSLTNGNFEEGNLNGWTYINGGNGWGLGSWAAHAGSYGAISSYDWCTLSQEIDLVDYLGYSTETLDTAPTVNMSAYASSRINNDPYSIKIELRNASHSPIRSYTSSGTLGAGFTWIHISTSTSGYGPGLRYIYFEMRGKDSVYWAGQYGSMFDDAIIHIGDDFFNPLHYVAGTGGSITGSSTQVLRFGGTGSSVTAAPAVGYYFSAWDDGSTSTSRTDTNITASTTHTANFSINSYTLSYSAGAHGSLTGSTTQTVAYGGSASAVTAVPEAHYHFVSWSDSSTSNPRTDSNVATGSSYSASFAIDSYSLSYSAGTGGSVSGSLAQTVNYGDSGSAVTAVANGGYEFSSWSDGSTQNPRTDTGVSASVSVTARFNSLPGASPAPEPSLGSGKVDVAIPMHGEKAVGEVVSGGTNVLGYVGSTGDFSAIVSGSQAPASHRFEILEVDMLNKKIKIRVMSEPVIIELGVGDGQAVDLDGDGKGDIALKFNDLLRNRVDLTISQLATAAASGAEEKAAVEKEAPRAEVEMNRYFFKRDLKVGRSGEDVRELQKFLNRSGFIVNRSGNGSPGKETASFGSLTQKALAKFQQANDIKPAAGYFGPLTRKIANGDQD